MMDSEYIKFINMLYNNQRYEELEISIRMCFTIFDVKNDLDITLQDTNITELHEKEPKIHELESFIDKINKVSNTLYNKHIICNCLQTYKNDKDFRTVHCLDYYPLISLLLSYAYLCILLLIKNLVTIEMFDKICPFKDDNKIYCGGNYIIMPVAVKTYKTFKSDYYYLYDMYKCYTYRNDNKISENEVYNLYSKQSNVPLNTDIYHSVLNNIASELSKYKIFTQLDDTIDKIINYTNNISNVFPNLVIHTQFGCFIASDEASPNDTNINNETELIDRLIGIDLSDLVIIKKENTFHIPTETVNFNDIKK